MTPLLEVADLRIDLPGPRGYVPIVDGVDFEVRTGQIFGLAGESGIGECACARPRWRHVKVGTGSILQRDTALVY